MNSSNYLDKIRNELLKLEKYHVVIYGSFLSEDYNPYKSDIDIAIITHYQEKDKNIAIWKEILGEFNENYDIKIFELLPLYLKIEIIENYKVLFGNALKISESLYHYRSIWKDMAHRIESNRFNSINEKIELLEKRSENM